MLLGALLVSHLNPNGENLLNGVIFIHPFKLQVQILQYHQDLLDVLLLQLYPPFFSEINYLIFYFNYFICIVNLDLVIIKFFTHFSVKNGVFRYYKMGRDKDSMISFIRERKWETVETISSWKSPNSIQMSLVAQFFKLSQKVRVSIDLFLII